MQPPPPPLNIEQLKMLIADADIIGIGKITGVKEAEGTLEATLSIEELLKGKVDGNTIGITETYKVLNPPPTASNSKTAGEPPQMITRTIAGVSAYSGKYKKDARIIVFLKNIEGTDQYKPLGSGTYNKYLGEFIIENDGIKSIEIDYFKFAQDVGKYAGSEKQFISFIEQLIKSGSNKGGYDE